MSSMTPVIAVKTDPLTKKRQVQMISGAAGGTKIISATALVRIVVCVMAPVECRRD